MLLKDFYSVESSREEDGKCITHLKINKNHRLYNGHFPNRPVTPGVILMQLFKEDAERRIGKSLQLKNANNIKFMAVVDPEIHNELFLEYHFEDNSQEIRLKGIAKTNEGISLKINAIYKLI
ncbi:MAG: hydroxymyristoyl-ACP dehydratase [Salegentibacter sp.]|uniref:3-hydroxyacyl-[acyl-carrier-protein] dehydratase n=1 Tax=Salegentibacter flavus TaxID=287099 RepID=A0A1I4ZAP6_9FLAO|nr:MULTISPECIES: hydroxymyristoyl-ACP dehydratase [Salegentibacter]MDR9456315.1 hydroxymyristoyl-ACP dehydratase [Salegentibacter sp.]SFN47039.1 3-hydroxyacyl-[acyl-carrier-protein] dehydratase [Salegentibacter flavus]